MASSNQTVADSGSEFECDGTQRTAKLLSPGGKVSNTGAVDAYINTDAGPVTVTQPGGASNIPLPVGSTITLPRLCSAFTFKSTAGSTYITVSPKG